jgi:predicted alpha/beta-hydrolase family hydrolase
MKTPTNSKAWLPLLLTCFVPPKTLKWNQHFVWAGVACLLSFLGWGQNTSVDKAASIASKETASRTVEDGGTGPYKALMASDKTLATHTVFRPRDLSALGDTVKLPIVAWGNGACANSPWEHVNFLSEVASHGFLVIAIGPMPAEGQRGGARGPTKSPMLIDAINWASAQNSEKSSQYYQKLDTNKIAIAGMSCGGLQALEVAFDTRISTVMICNSGILGDPGKGMPGMPNLTKDHLAQLHSPTIYILGGEKDIVYNNGMDDFKRINHLPIFAANLDVGHGGTYGKPHGGQFAKVATAWLQWQLKGDKEAAKMFVGDPCELAKAQGWIVEKKNIP